MIIKDCLSEKELIEIQRFIENPVLKEAVKKVLLYQIYTSGTLTPDKAAEPFTNFAFSFLNGETSDSVVGGKLRAAYEGALMVEAGFRDIDKLKIQEEKLKDIINQAR